MLRDCGKGCVYSVIVSFGVFVSLSFPISIDKGILGAYATKATGSIVTLFVVAIEVLAISLRSNEHIEGITIDNDEIKTLLYADDMTATLTNTSSVEIFMVLY